MALVPTLIDVPFEGGLDTNTDKKKVLPAKLLELDNAVFDGSSIAIRPGGSFLEDGVAAGGPALSSARALSVVGGELLRWTEDGVYGRSSATAPWVRRADAVDANPLGYEVAPLVQRPYSCELIGQASLFGVTVYVWTEGEASRRVLRASVIDDATGTRFQDAVELAADTSGNDDWRVMPRILTCGGSLVLLYGVAGAGATTPLYARTLLPSAPQAFSAATNIATMQVRPVGPYEYRYEFDAVDRTTGSVTTGTTGTLAVVYSAAVGGLTLQQFTVLAGAPPIATTPAAVTFAPLGPPAPDEYSSVHIFSDDAQTRLYVLLYNYADFTGQVHTFDASHVLMAQNVFASGYLPFKATALDDGAGSMTAYLAARGAAVISTTRWSAAGAILATGALWLRGAHLGGRAFEFDGSRYIPLAYSDLLSGGGDQPGTQPTLFIVEATTKRVVARALAGTAGFPFSEAPILAPAIISDDSATLLIPVRGRAEYDVTSGFPYDVTATGVCLVTLRRADPATLFRVEQDGALHVGGAAPSMYDGNTWTEDGFHVQPEGVTASSSGAGSLSAGTYSWVACYEWNDSRGRLHRSAPSVPATVTVAAGARAAVVVPFLRLTTKTNVRIALYRTQANGVVFFRAAASGLSYTQPSTLTANTVTLLDDASDTSIGDNEVLSYGGASGGSVGGELWRRPPPGYATAHKHQDYLLTTVMDDPYTVAYTLPLTKGEGPAWADELRLNVPSAQGPVVALGTLDDKLIILCERGAYAVLGRGPTRDGGNNGFSEPQYITGSVGCLSAASVVSTPDGLMYQSPNGIYLLSRSLETVKLGAGVQEYSGQTVARALDVPERRELRWYTQEGRTLVYSLEWRQWSTWTEQPTRDALLFQDVVHYADGSRVRYEDPDSILEGGAPISMVVGTSWLKWAGFSGFQRVWKALLVGQAGVTCTLRSDVFYDYEDVTPGQTLENTLPGRSVGGPPALRVRQTLGQQLCNTLRFRWTLTPAPTGPTDSGKLGLTSLTLEFGAHRGTAKRRVSSL